MEETWLIIASYPDAREANYAADVLKAEGIPCHTIMDERGGFLFGGSKEEDWIYLEVREEDYEEAADLLQIDPPTIDEIEADFAPERVPDSRKTNRLMLWGGLFTGFILLRLLAELF
jgi:hypothetical protein